MQKVEVANLRAEYEEIQSAVSDFVAKLMHILGLFLDMIYF